VDRTVANTTPVFHGGYLLATKEDGRPYRMNPHTLETYGSWDYAGKLKSETMTAHVRVDPVTGEMFSFGYEATGLGSKTMSYFIVDKDGQLQSEQFFDAPYCGMVHDMGLTERHVVFPVFPTTADIDRLKAGGPHWVHEQNTPCWVGIMPRYGKVEAMRWFPGPPGSSAYHLMNCFDEGDTVHMDFCWSDTNGFPFIREDSGIHKSMQEIQGGLLRWSFNLADPAPNLAVRGLGPPGDLPRIADADHGRPYTRGWYITVDPQAGPPIPAGPVNAACNLLLRVEPHTGRIDALPLGAGWAFNEPQHVPAKDPAHGRCHRQGPHCQGGAAVPLATASAWLVGATSGTRRRKVSGQKRRGSAWPQRWVAQVRSSSPMTRPSAAARFASRRSRSMWARPSGTGSTGSAATLAS
jgi:carotenoid cleavage dioxygenase